MRRIPRLSYTAAHHDLEKVWPGSRWFSDAGGISDISRWRQPPEHRPQSESAPEVRRIQRSGTPAGARQFFHRFRRLTPPANFSHATGIFSQSFVFLES